VVTANQPVHGPTSEVLLIALVAVVAVVTALA